MAEFLKRYIHEEGQFGALVVQTTELARDAYRRHQCDPLATQMLAQMMTGTLLISANLKGEGSVQAKMRGGQQQHIVAEADTLGHVRGYAELGQVEDFDPAQGIFDQVFGGGVMEVKRRTLPANKLFSSVVELVRGELSLQFANYLLQSDQLRAGILLGAQLDPDLMVKGAGGVMIYALPSSKDDLLFILENRLQELPPLGALFADDQGHEKIAEFLFSDVGVKALGETPIKFQCSCSQQRMLQVIHSLPATELKDLRTENKSFDINCQFCATSYTILPEDLDAILELKQNPSQS